MGAGTMAAVTAIKTLTLLIGAAVTYFSYRAYRRTGSDPLGLLATGFGIITFGSLSAGVVDQFLPLSPAVALLVESSFTLAGFATVLYSLFAGGPAPARGATD